MPKILDFENKREYFRMKIDLKRSYSHRLNILVRRHEIFSDSYNQIISKRPDELTVSPNFLSNLPPTPLSSQNRAQNWRKNFKIV